MKVKHPLPDAGNKIRQTEWVANHILPAGALGNKSGSVSLSLDDGTVQTATLTGNVTFTLPSVPAGTTEHLTLILTNDDDEIAITVTSALWMGGEAPDLNDADGAVNVLVFRGINGQWIADGGTAE